MTVGLVVVVMSTGALWPDHDDDRRLLDEVNAIAILTDLWSHTRSLGVAELDGRRKSWIAIEMSSSSVSSARAESDRVIVIETWIDSRSILISHDARICRCHLDATQVSEILTTSCSWRIASLA